MKLVLIQPPVRDFYDTPIRLQPIGLAYLKAAVKRHLPDVEVVIRDFHQGQGRRTAALPGELAYLREYYPWPDQSPFSLFHHYFHFGAAFETIAQETAREKPDLVGISSLFSPYYQEVLRCAEAIKKKVDCRIVVGGPHASALPETMPENPAVDWVIRGEGERPLVDLIQRLQSGRGFEDVPALVYKKDGRLAFNPSGPPASIEDIPVPDLSDLDQKAYEFERRPLCVILFSRGCPHRCSFCSVHTTFPGYRRRPAKAVFEEIVGRYREGYRVFDFEDDNLTYDQKELKNLCRMLQEAFPAGEVEFLAMNGVSSESLDQELLVLMRQAGFTRLNLSLVTSNPRVRRQTFRPQGLKKYIEMVNEAFRLGFKIVSYQILGLPEEPLDSMIRTLGLNSQLPVLLGASPFYLTPGTVLARRFPGPKASDLLKSRLTAMAVETPLFKREDLYTLFTATRIINFFKGLRFEEDRLGLKEALKLARIIGKRSALGAELFERLQKEGRLYTADPQGSKFLPKFNSALFHNLWSRLDHIKTQTGKMIEI